MKIAIILWTRPEIIKCSSILRFLQDQSKIEWYVVHTNQHYSQNMDSVFFDELNILWAKYNLWIGSGTHGDMTWRMMVSIEKILLLDRPDIVLVQGDTNTVLAGWLVAVKLGIKVGHIEAWLRSYDMHMPEEINRIVVDKFSDYCFCPTKFQEQILLDEGVSKNRVFVTWNTIVDAVYEWLKIGEQISKSILSRYLILSNEYIFFTSHRPSNVDDAWSLKNLLVWMKMISDKSGKTVFFPVHPRTSMNIMKFWLQDYVANFIMTEPVGFIENLILQKHAYIVATDSWWIQEEACILKKKTLILRDNTERPETLDVWWAMLVGNDPSKILKAFVELSSKEIHWYNPFGNGLSWEKIIQIIKASLTTV